MKVLWTLVLIFYLVSFAEAQDRRLKTKLSGTVYDDNGAVIVNSKVSIRGKDNFESIVFTNEEGIFEINLADGNYSIEVTSPGFQTFKLEKYRIAPAYEGKLNLDFVLEVGPCSDCHRIEVEPIKKAVLSGTVYYGEKDKVENAVIQVRRSDGNSFETKTDKNGYYKLELMPGFYEITFEHCSIEKEIHNVEMQAGQRLLIDVKQKNLIVDGCGMVDERPVETPQPKLHKKITKRKNN